MIEMAPAAIMIEPALLSPTGASPVVEVIAAELPRPRAGGRGGAPVSARGCGPLHQTHLRSVAHRARTGEGRIVFDSIGTPAPGSGLHQCALCHAECVVPVWWESVDDDRWHMLLRCGACGTYRDVTAGDDVAQAYERDIERGARQIRAALERMDRDRMAVQADAFAAAL